MVGEAIPLGNKWRHHEREALGLVECLTHGFSQGAERIVKDQQVLVLVGAEGSREVDQDGLQVGYELKCGFFFECRKRRAGGLLDTFVLVQDALQEAKENGLKEGSAALRRGCLFDAPPRKAAERPTSDGPYQRFGIVQTL